MSELLSGHSGMCDDFSTNEDKKESSLTELRQLDIKESSTPQDNSEYENKKTGIEDESITDTASDSSQPKQRPRLNYLRSAWTSDLYYSKSDLQNSGLSINEHSEQETLVDAYRIPLPPFQLHDQDDEDNDEVNNEILYMVYVGNILCLIGSICGTLFVLSSTSNLSLSVLLHKKAWIVHTTLPLCIIWWSIMILVLKNKTEDIKQYLTWTQASAIIMVGTNFGISKYALLPEQQKQEQQLFLFHILFGSLAMVAFALFSFAKQLHQANHLKAQRLRLKILTETNKMQDYVDEITKDYTHQRVALMDTVSQEVQDVALMVITTLEQFSPTYILSSTHELLNACSIAVPIASISAINTTIRQVCHISSHLKLLSLLATQSWQQHSRDKPYQVEQSNSITLPKLASVDFDIGELLQNIGDALAGVASKLDVNLVIYHHDNTLHHSIVIGDEGVIRHTLLNYLRNILECCTSGSCIEVGLQVSHKSTESNKLQITFYIIHTLPENCKNAGSALLPNANLTAQLLTYINAESTVDIDKNQMRFEFSFELESGSHKSENNRRYAKPELTSFKNHYANVKFSNEPSIKDLTNFIEHLKGLKMVLYAPEQSTFAKHLTSCLTSWNTDISHVPISTETNPSVASESEEGGSETDTSISSNTINNNYPTRPSPLSLKPSTPPIPSPVIEEENIHLIPHAFILIDDDILTLEQKLNEFKSLPPVSANVFQALHGSRRQQIHKHQKSSINNHSHQNFFHRGTTAIIHFTSLTNYKAVRDVIQIFAASSREPFSMPRIVVVPKPAGPRRFLTALHTAWNNSVVDPHFSAIATSPLSPMTPYISQSIQRELTSALSSQSQSVDHQQQQQTSPGRANRKPMSGIFSPPMEGANHYFAPHISSVTNEVITPTGTNTNSPRRKSNSESQHSVDYLTAKFNEPPLIPTTPDPLDSQLGVNPIEASILDPISLKPVVSAGTESPTEPSTNSSEPVKSRTMFKTMSNFKLNKKKKKDRGTPFANAISPPINVLIVEDNPINQAILSTWMKKHNIIFSVVSNGLEAVEKWKGGGFHLVLMDIQLPVMNGLEATKMIRSIEKERKIGVLPMSSSFLRQQHAIASAAAAATVVQDAPPVYEIEMISDIILTDKDKNETPSKFRSPVIIVALTASSLDSDRHAALAAGCNDFLTKPLSLKWLEKKIIEWGCMQALIDFEGWRRWKKTSAADQNKGEEKCRNHLTTSTLLSSLTVPPMDDATREKMEIEKKRIEELSKLSQKDGLLLHGVSTLIKSRRISVFDQNKRSFNKKNVNRSSKMESDIPVIKQSYSDSTHSAKSK
ncbi:hypothetical protein BDB01DRAFT_850879 [Pilobolus umbonatus]|nr:hypothetical protein BDB01DRAFT_850879 [Pilobolus umbonatus]